MKHRNETCHLGNKWADSTRCKHVNCVAKYEQILLVVIYECLLFKRVKNGKKKKSVLSAQLIPKSRSHCFQA